MSRQVQRWLEALIIMTLTTGVMIGAFLYLGYQLSYHSGSHPESISDFFEWLRT